MAQINIEGEEPYLYASRKFRKFSEEVFIKYYGLMTGDSFEVGDAYSLHSNESKARKFMPERWWRQLGDPEKVFVPKSLLEKITNREATKKNMIFGKMENGI